MSETGVQLNEHQEALCRQTRWDFCGLPALFVNCTLKRSPEMSHTQGLVELSTEIMRRQAVTVDHVRAADHDIVPGRRGSSAGGRRLPLRLRQPRAPVAIDRG